MAKLAQTEIDPRQLGASLYDDIRKRMRPGVCSNRTELIKTLVRGKTVLDIGCVNHCADTLAWEDWLHGNICSVAKEAIGLDYEVEEVRKLQEQGYKVVAGDATQFDLKRTFDVVVAGDVLEHLLDARGFLRSARQHLNSDGILVLTVPNANSVNYFMQNLLFGYEVDGFDHAAFYTPLTLFNLLRKSAFEVDEVIFLQPNTSIYHRSWTDRLMVQLMRAFQAAFIYFRPSVSRQFCVVARRASEKETAGPK